MKRCGAQSQSSHLKHLLFPHGEIGEYRLSSQLEIWIVYLKLHWSGGFLPELTRLPAKNSLLLHSCSFPPEHQFSFLLWGDSSCHCALVSVESIGFLPYVFMNYIFPQIVCVYSKDVVCVWLCRYRPKWNDWNFLDEQAVVDKNMHFVRLFLLPDL